MATLTGEEKGALLLKSLAPDVVEKVLALLGPERRARMRQTMNRLPMRPEMQSELESLLRELQNALTAKTPNAQQAAAPAILPMTPTPRAAEATTNNIEPDLSDPLAALVKLPAERIATVLADETPRTVSLILNYLDVAVAGNIFKRLTPEMRNQVSVQFSSQILPSLDILKHIAHALVRKSQQIAERPRFPAGIDRNRKMADMLRLLDKPDRLQVLEALEVQDAAAAAEIKDLLYRFEDVLRIENRSMQRILMDIDVKNLALAIAGANDDVKSRFVSNLSKRAQDNLQEELDLMRSAPKDQVERAQKDIVAVIQRLDLAGDLVMDD